MDVVLYNKTCSMWSNTATVYNHPLQHLHEENASGFTCDSLVYDIVFFAQSLGFSVHFCEMDFDFSDMPLAYHFS